MHTGWCARQPEIDALTAERDQLRADLQVMTNRLRIARKKAAGLKAQRNTALVKFAELQEVVDALNNAGQCSQCVRMCMNANRREAALAAQSK